MDQNALRNILKPISIIFIFIITVIYSIHFLNIMGVIEYEIFNNSIAPLYRAIISIYCIGNVAYQSHRIYFSMKYTKIQKYFISSVLVIQWTIFMIFTWISEQPPFILFVIFNHILLLNNDNI